MHGFEGAESVGGGGLRCRRVTDARSLLSVSPPPLVPPLLRVGLMRPTVGMTADLNSHAVERVGEPRRPRRRQVFVSLYDDGAVPPFTVALLSLGALLLLDPPPSLVLADGGGGPQPLPSRGLRGSAKGGPPLFFLFLCFLFILCI